MNRDTQVSLMQICRPCGIVRARGRKAHTSAVEDHDKADGAVFVSPNQKISAISR
jgi:hypothetical protein